MHTVIVLAIGFGLLALSALAGQFVAGSAGLVRALLAFVPLWFIGAAINMYIGVARAGYSVADEAPIFALIFLVPVLVALGLWWRLR
jgi:hypothetical protein